MFIQENTFESLCVLQNVDHFVQVSWCQFLIAGRGLTTDGCTTFINASTCSWKYKPDYPPIIFDLPIPEGHSKDELLQDLKVTSYENGNRADPTGADAQDEDMVEGSSCVVM